ncbi:MAG: nucleotidyltransferase domain-containing protein [Candidatus Caldarchaeum sp.]|nr:nucleotidyltransferase domain-containing protein [Candidatus Caldarchaeum sp.]MDW7977458.1 nucleotidyltransferase domain-containing protein [Candidatus Caldarchaeum sp.]
MIGSYYVGVVRKVKEIVHQIDPEARVYVFGSVVRGESTAASDIDVLVVTKLISRKYDIMVKVYRSLDEPVELHVATDDMLERWYRRFIPADELVEV